MTTATKFSTPAENEYDSYYHQYISLFQPQDFVSEFRSQPQQLVELFQDVDAAELQKPHDPFTWTIKEVVGHLLDCERIFSTRALRIGVGDETPIPGISQNVYVDNLNYAETQMTSLLEEYQHLRTANALLADRMDLSNLERGGLASNCYVTARANFYILAGHFVYHYNIIEKRLR